MGRVDKLPIGPRVRCSWRISPVGSYVDLIAIENTIEIMKAEHPYDA